MFLEKLKQEEVENELLAMEDVVESMDELMIQGMELQSEMAEAESLFMLEQMNLEVKEQFASESVEVAHENKVFDAIKKMIKKFIDWLGNVAQKMVLKIYAIVTKSEDLGKKYVYNPDRVGPNTTVKWIDQSGLESKLHNIGKVVIDVAERSVKEWKESSKAVSDSEVEKVKAASQKTREDIDQILSENKKMMSFVTKFDTEISMNQKIFDEAVAAYNISRMYLVARSKIVSGLIKASNGVSMIGLKLIAKIASMGKPSARKEIISNYYYANKKAMEQLSSTIGKMFIINNKCAAIIKKFGKEK